MRTLSLSSVFDRDVVERKIAVPGLSSFLVAGILALPFGVALQASFLGVLLLSLLVAALGYVCRNSSLAFLLLGSAFAVQVALLFVLGRLWPSYGIDARLVVVVSALLAFGGAWVFRARVRLGQLGLPTATGSAFVMSLLVWPGRRMNDAESLAFVAGVDWFAEDNGAWMQALAKMSDGSATRLNIDGIYGAGHGTELMLAVTREFNHLFSPWFDGTWASNAKVLVASYGFASLGVVLLGLILARQFFAAGQTWKEFSLVPLAIVMFALSAGMAEVGHYSALVAVGFVLLGVTLGTVDHGSRLGLHPGVSMLTLLALFASSQTWIALFPIVVLVTLIVLIRLAADRFRSPTRRSVRQFLLVGAALALAVLIAWRRFFGGYTSLFRWENVSTLIRLGGGVQTMQLELVLVIWALAVALLISLRRGGNASMMRDVVVAVILVGVAIALIAMSIPPYTLAYGPLKIVYMISMVLAPLAYVLVIGSMADRVSAGFALLAGVVCVLLVGLMSPPGAEWTWMYKTPPEDRWSWAPAVAGALKTTEPVSVGCLTVDESGRPQEDPRNYLCARFSFGLTGTVTNRDHNLWMWAHSCDKNRESYANSWSDEFLVSFTVLVQVKDIGKPCGSSDSSPVNPFEFLDWSKVNLIDVNGKSTVIPR